MKLMMSDSANMMIYLNQHYVKSINLDHKDSLEKYFRNLFRNLKKNHGVNITGYYNIRIRTDEFYGMVIELEKEDIDYYDYFINQVDMRIVVEKNSCFLYEVSDLFFLTEPLTSKINAYRFENKIYIKLTQEPSELELGVLLENSNIIFDELVGKVLHKGKQILYS